MLQDNVECVFCSFRRRLLRFMNHHLVPFPEDPGTQLAAPFFPPRIMADVSAIGHLLCCRWRVQLLAKWPWERASSHLQTSWPGSLARCLLCCQPWLVICGHHSPGKPLSFSFIHVWIRYRNPYKWRPAIPACNDSGRISHLNLKCKVPLFKPPRQLLDCWTLKGLAAILISLCLQLCLYISLESVFILTLLIFHFYTLSNWHLRIKLARKFWNKQEGARNYAMTK